MNDLRRFIMRAFQRGKRQTNTFRRLKSADISRELILYTTKQ